MWYQFYPDRIDPEYLIRKSEYVHLTQPSPPFFSLPLRRATAYLSEVLSIDFNPNSPSLSLSGYLYHYERKLVLCGEPFGFGMTAGLNNARSKLSIWARWWKSWWHEKQYIDLHLAAESLVAREACWWDGFSLVAWRARVLQQEWGWRFKS